MMRSKKGDVVMSPTLNMLLLAVVFVVIMFLLYKGVNSYMDSNKCPSTGIWTDYSCDISVSTYKPLSSDKNHEKENCCIPISGKEKEFKKWANSLNLTSDIRIEAVSEQSDDVEFMIGEKKLKPGELIEIDSSNMFKVSAIKKTDLGDKCIARVYQAKRTTKIVRLEDKDPKIESQRFNYCPKGQVLDLGEFNFPFFKVSPEEDEKNNGLYILEVDVYDESLNKETVYTAYLHSFISFTETN